MGNRGIVRKMRMIINTAAGDARSGAHDTAIYLYKVCCFYRVSQIFKFYVICVGRNVYTYPKILGKDRKSLSTQTSFHYVWFGSRGELWCGSM